MVEARRWFVAVTTAGGEFLAQSEINAEAADGRTDVAVFLPQDRPRVIVRTNRLGKELSRKTIRVPLMRGYVFVQFDPSIGAWRRLYSTRGVERLLGMDPRRPQPLCSRFVEHLIRRSEASGVVPDPVQAMLTIGARVRVVGHQWLEGSSGTVSAVRRGLARIEFAGFTWDAWLPAEVLVEVEATQEGGSA